jgi:hypothetical protein
MKSSAIQALVDCGADAMDNMFDVVINLPSEVIKAAKETIFSFSDAEIEERCLGVRADGFEPPKLSGKTMTVDYKTLTIEKPAGKIAGQRQFSITFRLDAAIHAYMLMKTWESFSCSPEFGFAAPAALSGDTGQYFGTIDVNALATYLRNPKDSTYKYENVDGTFKSTATYSWKFQQVWVSEVSEPKFKTGGGDALYVTAKFNFIGYKTPFTTGYAGSSYIESRLDPQDISDDWASESKPQSLPVDWYKQ